MKKALCLSLFLILALTLPMSAQSNDGWVFKNEKSGVKVFYRKTGGIYEVKLITSIQSTLSGLITLLSEAEHYQEWGYKIAESRMLQKYSNTESVYYSRLDFPWPLDDRDIVMHNRVEQDPVSRRVVATSIAKPTLSPINDGVVRIENAKTIWTIVPGAGGWLYVEYYIYSDPGGNLPDWLVNMAIDVGPRETIQSIRKFVQQPRYQTVKLAHIKD